MDRLRDSICYSVILRDEGLQNIYGSPVMFLFLGCSAVLPYSYDHVPLWTKEVGNFNNTECLYPLIGLRNKAVIQILLTSEIIYSYGILSPL